MYRKRYGSGKNKRGLNKYTPRLIRPYIPKKTDFNTVNELHINELTVKQNKRPRIKLDYKSPGKIFLSKFNQNVALAS